MMEKAVFKLQIWKEWLKKQKCLHFCTKNVIKIIKMNEFKSLSNVNNFIEYLKDLGLYQKKVNAFKKVT